MNGLHYQDTMAGRIFSQAVTPLGLALPIYTATAICGAGICGLPLYNPTNSNRNVEIISLDLDYGSGTSAYCSIGMMGMPLSSVATGQLCSAFNTTTPMGGYLGGGNASKVKSSNGASAVTVTAGTAGAPTDAAPGWIRGMFSLNLEAQTGTAHGPSVNSFGFQGTVNVPPGWMIYFAATLATVSLLAGTLVWKEIPINPNGG